MRFLFSPKFLIFFIPYFLVFLISSQNALFWDTIQFAGDHPNWYYSNHFQYFFLPEYCDSGHPPAFGMYLAAVWTVLGRSLFISHLAMLPFIMLLVAQAVKAGSNLFPGKYRSSPLITLLVLSESVLLTQCSLVSPDIWVAAFFLLAINSIVKGNKWLLVLAVAFMGIISTRAMMCSVALYLFSLVYDSDPELHKTLRSKISLAWQKLRLFLPGAVLAGAYFTAHYLAKGWVGAPKNSTWAGGFERLPVAGVLKNIALLGWRFVDLGKVLTMVVFVVATIQWLRGKLLLAVKEQIVARALFALVVALLAITALPLTLYQGLLTHRYLIPATIAICLFTAYILLQSRARYRLPLIFAMILVQFSGHFWTYPRSVSQGWEGTLGHLFFYDMQRDFRQFMDAQHIAKTDVATSPTLAKSDYRVFLGNDTTTFKDFERDTTQYVWYSNVTNAMNEKAGYYFEHFDIVKEERKGHVEMVLFRRRGAANNFQQHQ